MTQLKATRSSPIIILCLFLGFSSGLPLALSYSTLQAWFTTANISLKAIGSVSLLSIPYTLKFLWAPLMDRWVPPFLGRRRGWMLISQLGLIAVILAMSFCSPDHDTALMFFLAFLIAFLSASQDIAIDAYRTDILKTEDKAMGAAMNVNGYRIAMLVSGGLALLLADQIGWHMTYALMAVIMLVGVVATLFSPVPATDKIVAHSWRECTVHPFVDFMKRPSAIHMLLFIALYKLGEAFASSLMSAFLIRGIGFSLSEIGTIVKFVGFFATLAGSTLGGFLVPRLGWFNSLLYFGIFQAASNVASLLLLWTGPNNLVLGLVIFLENACSGCATAAFVGLLMSLCNAKYTAFQFALLSSLSAVGRVFVGGVAGAIAEHYGWATFFILSIILAVPGLWLLLHIKNNLEGMMETTPRSRLQPA